jgi:hypothetical protein
MAKLTKNGVTNALKKLHGNISATARCFVVSRTAIRRYIKADPELADIVTDAREALVDDAESVFAESLASEDVNVRLKAAI